MKALAKRGFEIKRVSGSHHILGRRDGSGNRIIVPIHGARDLPPGTVRSIIAQAGLSIDEFMALL